MQSVINIKILVFINIIKVKI